MGGSAQNDSLYKIAIQKADSAYEFKWISNRDRSTDDKNFLSAKNLYNAALQIKPTAIYPTQRIKEIDFQLYDYYNKPVFKKYVLIGDSLFDLSK